MGTSEGSSNMTLIKVDPSLLQSSGQDIQSNAQNISSLGSQLWNVVERAPSYDSQFFPKVAAIGAEAQSRANQLSGNLANLGERLQTKAMEFEAVDNAAVDGFGSLIDPIDVSVTNTEARMADFAQNYLTLGQLITYAGYGTTAVEKIVDGGYGNVFAVEGAIVQDFSKFNHQPDRFIGATVVDSVVDIGAPVVIGTVLTGVIGATLAVTTGGLIIPFLPVIAPVLETVDDLAGSYLWDKYISPTFENSELRYSLIDRTTATIDDIASHPAQTAFDLATGNLEMRATADFIGGQMKALADQFLPSI